jgi:L-threonylcarbamoyladenylate synthase
VKDAQKIAVLDKHSLHLMRKFMPGPLTLVARAKGSIAKNVHGNGKIAFRISSNKFLQKLCKKYKNPITATSANLSGQPPIYAPKELTETFDKKVDAIANAGKLRMRKPSTIFDATAMKILREGPVSKRKIFLALSSR